MEQSKRIKLNPAQMLIIKMLIAVLAVWFIYRKVFEKENIQSLFDEYKNIFSDHSKLILFSVIILLMLLNWSVEAVKWRMMIKKIYPVTFLKSLEAVFSGLTISFFTPNRIGEYAGRVFHLSSSQRIKATLITIIENSSQLLVTMVVGSVCSMVYLKRFAGIEGNSLISISVLLLLFTVGCLLLFLNVSVMEIVINRFRFAKRWEKYTEVFHYYRTSELVNLILLASLRYLIFTTQFYLLLVLFDVHISFFTSFVLIAMVFYVMSLIPTIALTEIGIRGAVAYFFFGHVTDQYLAVLNTTISLWMINLVLPALIGTIFVFMFNLGKEKT